MTLCDPALTHQAQGQQGSSPDFSGTGNDSHAGKILILERFLAPVVNALKAQLAAQRADEPRPVYSPRIRGQAGRDAGC